ncbi:hypothetical protein MNB_SUP05-SYMBIONT-5-1424 [hydrothermal vent metagenome]|uniref:Uncharacterized protein n=1 Tax=hydrothermal vent metagenome TaxID=652676 RepID=A0A1W1E532_9ZZZZ
MNTNTVSTTHLASTNANLTRTTSNLIIQILSHLIRGFFTSKAKTATRFPKSATLFSKTATRFSKTATLLTKTATLLKNLETLPKIRETLPKKIANIKTPPPKHLFTHHTLTSKVTTLTSKRTTLTAKTHYNPPP